MITQHGSPGMRWRRARDAADIGRGVSEFRRDAHMSQEELAEWLGVDRTTVVRLESGTLGALSRLTQALGVLGVDLVMVPRGARVEIVPEQGA